MANNDEDEDSDAGDDDENEEEAGSAARSGGGSGGGGSGGHIGHGGKAGLGRAAVAVTLHRAAKREPADAPVPPGMYSRPRLAHAAQPPTRGASRVRENLPPQQQQQQQGACDSGPDDAALGWREAGGDRRARRRGDARCAARRVEQARMHPHVADLNGGDGGAVRKRPLEA